MTVGALDSRMGSISQADNAQQVALWQEEASSSQASSQHFRTEVGARVIPASPYGLILVLAPMVSCSVENKGIAVNGIFKPCFKIKSSDLARPRLSTTLWKGEPLGVVSSPTSHTEEVSGPGFLGETCSAID